MNIPANIGNLFLLNGKLTITAKDGNKSLTFVPLQLKPGEVFFQIFEDNQPTAIKYAKACKLLFPDDGKTIAKAKLICILDLYRKFFLAINAMHIALEDKLYLN